MIDTLVSLVSGMALGWAACATIMARVFRPEKQRRYMWLYLVDGPLGPAFVNKAIVVPSGRTNIVRDGDGSEHLYTVFHTTDDVMFFAYDPDGKLVASLAPWNAN